MTLKSFNTLSGVLLLMACASFMLSCGSDSNDDKNDCEAFSKQLSEKTTAVTQALTSENCTEIQKAYNELLDLYEKGGKCDAFKKAVKDAGYDSYDDYVADLEEARDLFLADC
ncbi:MAG TPA: hypothetical protein VFW11_07615 [Cyclobacteriaceae bacterium]|nr:hypothetical protein [Cyclobacteriaceae bacterium]